MLQYYLIENTPGNALWLCHISNLVLGLSLILSLDKYVWISSFWLHIGSILWIWEILATGELSHWRSTVAHVGGTVGALYAARIIPIPSDRYLTIDAGFFALIVQVVSHLITDPLQNVNVSHRIHPAMTSIFVYYPNYLLFNFILKAVLLTLLELLLRKFWVPVPAKL